MGILPIRTEAEAEAAAADRILTRLEQRAEADYRHYAAQADIDLARRHCEYADEYDAAGNTTMSKAAILCAIELFRRWHHVLIIDPEAKL